MASLQNSVPVQATAPRQKLEPSTCRPIWSEFARQFRSLVVGDVDEDQVLRDGGAQCAAAEALGQIGGGFQLFAGQAAAQHGCADIAQARLPLADECRRDREERRREPAPAPPEAG